METRQLMLEVRIGKRTPQCAYFFGYSPIHNLFIHGTPCTAVYATYVLFEDLE